MKTAIVLITGIVTLCLSYSCNSTGSADKKNHEMDSPDVKSMQKSEDEGFVPIFDGQTTQGWRGYNKPAFPEKGWETIDGTLHCIGSGAGEAGSGGDILYDRKLSSFELKLEWKISEGGNSGIFILGQEIKDQPIWISAPEMQILDNDRHPDARLGVNGNRMAGSLYDLIPANPQNTKPAGEWNDVRILVYQGTVVFSQNGTDVVEFHLWTDAWRKMVENSKFKDYPSFVEPAREGFIGLQDHGNDVWFRNIRLKEL